MAGRGSKAAPWLTEEGLLKIQGWARDGLTDKDIAYNMGISETSIHIWKKRHPEIAEALKQGKEVADRIVENSLFKSAVGYDYDEVTTIQNESGEIVHTKRVKKHASPNPTSMIFWLKNRKPEVWRDAKKIDMAGKLETKNPFEGLTTEELKKLAGSGPDGS